MTASQPTNQPTNQPICSSMRTWTNRLRTEQFDCRRRSTEQRNKNGNRQRYSPKGQSAEVLIFHG